MKTLEEELNEEFGDMFSLVEIHAGVSERERLAKFIRTKIRETEKCPKCGEIMQRAEECKNHTGGWDEHTFKCPCTPGIYVSIG
jgi:hypothetical protein